MKELLEKAGFSNIIENDDGTIDATKDGQRYFGLYVTDIKQISNDDSIITVPMKFDIPEDKRVKC
jgi:hypothetical protein